MVAKIDHPATRAGVRPRPPTGAIPDDRAYRAVIRVLDRLFERGGSRTPAETESFRTLARLAHQYELAHPAFWA